MLTSAALGITEENMDLKKPSLNQISFLLEMIYGSSWIGERIDLTNEDLTWEILHGDNGHKGVSFRQYQYLQYLIDHNKRDQTIEVLVNLGFKKL